MTMMPEIDDGFSADAPNASAEAAAVSIPFSGLTPDYLKNQTEELTVRLRIGNTDPVSMEITLPAPSKSDLKTAAAAHQMTAEKRQNLIRSSIEKNNLWLTAYMCSVQCSENFFDPDYKYTTSVPFKADRSLLALACHDGTAPAAGLLLQCDGINVNNGSGNYQYGSPIWATVLRKDADSRDRIITMLGCYKELYIDDYYLKHVPTKTMRDYLAKIQTRNKTYLPPANKLKALTASKSADTQAATAVAFTDLPSETLLAQKQPLAVAFPIGDDKKIWVFDIPAPTASDLKTANRMEAMSTHKRQKLIRKAVMQKKTWLTAYMQKLWQERDSDKSWFDPNHQYSFEFAQDCTLPALSICDGNSAITAIILQCPDINISSYFRSYDPYCNPLSAALTHKNETCGATAVEMLCCFHRLQISDNDVLTARTKEMHDFLKLAQADRKKAQTPQEKKADTPQKRKAIAESTLTDTETGTVWEKIDSSTICKLSCAENAAYRLRRVFNFKSGTLSEVHEYLNEDGQVQTATAQNITPFSKLGSSREVAEAQAQLKLMIPAGNAAKTARRRA